MDKFFDVLCNIVERAMLSALIVIIMLFLPIAWSAMIYCSGGVVACSLAVMLFTGATFFVRFLTILRKTFSLFRDAKNNKYLTGF